jgi:preprotein translocase subunit SecA
VTITDKGFLACEALLGKSLFDPADPWAPFVLNAIKVGR